MSPPEDGGNEGMRRISELTRENILRQTRRSHHPQGYYEEDWIDDQQAEEDYQKPEKFQKIANMVSLNRVSEDPPVQHHRGGCSQCNVYRHVQYYV